MDDNKKYNLEKQDLINLDDELKKLSERTLKSKTDLFTFFSDVNTIIKESFLYVNVKEAVEEVSDLIQSYKEFEKDGGEFVVDVTLYLNENKPIRKFEMTFTEEDDSILTRQGDIVLQCTVKYTSKNFSISPSIYFVFYDEDEQEDIIFEGEEDEKDGESLKLKSVTGLEDDDDDMEEYTDEDFEEYSDEMIKDLLKNIIVSKIYEEGYDYPNEEAIDELAEKMFHAMNDIMQQYLIKDTEEEDESSESEREEGNEEGVQSNKRKWTTDDIEIYEEKSSGKEHYNENITMWLFTIKLPSKVVVSYVVDGNNEKNARENLTKEVLERHGTEKYEVLNVLPIKETDFKE